MAFLLLIGGALSTGVHRAIEAGWFRPTQKSISWANGTLTDQALRTIELGLREDHIVVWRVPVSPTPTPAPPPPEAVSQP